MYRCRVVTLKAQVTTVTDDILNELINCGVEKFRDVMVVVSTFSIA